MERTLLRQHLITGKQAENSALKFLQAKGFKLIVQNFRCKVGEIDLIMEDKKFWVFIEVRYRKNNNYGLGLETVNKMKQQRLIRAATFYLQQQNLLGKVDCRFDIISFNGNKIDWIKNAFDGNSNG